LVDGTERTIEDDAEVEVVAGLALGERIQPESLLDPPGGCSNSGAVV
jgi:hypothetical protein